MNKKSVEKVLKLALNGVKNTGTKVNNKILFGVCNHYGHIERIPEYYDFIDNFVAVSKMFL